MSATQLQIIDGGNKFELFAQLSDIGRFDRNHLHHSPSFRLEVKYYHSQWDTEMRRKFEASVYGLFAKDYSGDNWGITGTVITDGYTSLDDEFRDVDHRFHGSYNTRTREGVIYPGYASLVAQ